MITAAEARKLSSAHLSKESEALLLHIETLVKDASQKGIRTTIIDTEDEGPHVVEAVLEKLKQLGYEVKPMGTTDMRGEPTGRCSSIYLNW